MKPLNAKPESKSLNCQRASAPEKPESETAFAPVALSVPHHPTRPPAPRGRFYEASDKCCNKVFSLRSLDPASDLHLFHRWQNNSRVAEFWNEQGDLNHHRTYLQSLQDDPHSFAAIGYIDDVACAYFEIYWTLEDRLGPHYDSAPHDRGFRILIGEDSHAGKGFGSSWVRAVSHAIFLSDPKTRRIYCEPNAKNAALIASARKVGYEVLKEFDFPHKRAALLECTRQRFFS
ncbi:acetyltransferase [Caballeronia sp. EK]|uniref:GNAT family N-acetyltransferase n=1 Tax=Caballeronia sp. EK TaxID=2767469 RepID=UPI0019890193|nr:GNAT family N-acetyltransferase [Caballeronia sp. EK]MBC8642210.1 acetyltransferase [Caballeronia sp. EK]